MNDNSNEFSALGKDINSTLYAQDRATRVAKELGYSAVGGMNKMLQEIRQEMLEGNELVLINTGTATEDIEIVDADTVLSTGEINDSAVITNEADLNDFLSLKTELEADDADLDVDMRVSGAEQLKTMLSEKGYDLNDSQLATLNKVLKTAKPKISDKAFKLTTGTFKVGTKTGKLATKAGGKLVRFGKNFNVMDADGNVDAVQSGTNQMKTTAKWAGRNFIGKPAKYAGKKLNQKVMKKPVQAITKGINKAEAKITAKLAKMSTKGISKLLQILVKALAHIIKWLITALVSSLPVFIVFLVIVIIIVVVMSVFGGNMDDSQLQQYSSYMSEVSTEFQNKTKGYYDEGYKVDGTYNGVAYINWQAALSVMQILQPELDASESEFNLLDKMKSDGVMYTITETTTAEYERKPAEYDKDGNIIKEAVMTTKKYVVTVGILDDYKNWIKDNTSTVMSFYDKENLSYNSNTTSFLTTELSEDIDELYNSDDFSMLLEEAGITMGGGNGGGIIYDTGENKGVLAYPTTYRKITAGFPKYPSGKDHTGIDFPCPMNTPVCACEDGVVVLTKQLTYSYGRYIVIQHNIDGQTLYTLYAHNTTLYVKEGDTVKKGQHIADSGNTGNSTGPHCHLSVLTSMSPQTYVQPLNYL